MNLILSLSRQLTDLVLLLLAEVLWAMSLLLIWESDLWSLSLSSCFFFRYSLSAVVSSYFK